MNIATSNTKWQVVIPKAVRESLKLEPKTNFNVVVMGNNIQLQPIRHFVTHADGNEAFLELLRKNRGRWGAMTKKENEEEKKKRQFKLRAAKRRRNAW